MELTSLELQPSHCLTDTRVWVCVSDLAPASVQLHLAPSWSIRSENTSHSFHLRAFAHAVIIVWNVLPLPVCLLIFQLSSDVTSSREPPRNPLPLPYARYGAVTVLKALFHGTYQCFVT